MYLATPPFWLKWLYPSLIWNKSRNDKTIYLTFDDGPVPVVTPFVLNTLKKFDATATFFCVGDNVQKYPEIYKQVLQDGHSVGNHTFNHLKGWKTRNAEYISNVEKCRELVESNLFRPPYGRGTRSQYSILSAQYSIIMWDVLSCDFDEKISPEKCLQKVMQHSGNGSIVVFHDSLKAYPRLEYVLPLALQHWREKGYRFAGL
jgi:peptidoglycan-N-acetylglucosamine deacetylase